MAIRGGTVITPSGRRRECHLGIAGGLICAMGATTGEASSEIDASGLLVLPGLVDVHVHGAGGSEDPVEMARFLPRTGVTAFLPTLASASPSATVAFLEGVAGCRQEPGAAEVLGSHLEGPFLSPRRRGAHVAAHLRRPDVNEVEHWLRTAGSSLKRVTIAPELPGARQAIARLAAAGVQVSLGHSACSYEQALAAADWGAGSITHAFNAMGRFHHREPGLPGAALACERLVAELIADGVHVHPAAARALLSARGSAGVAVISDGLPALGAPAGLCRWQGLELTSDGAAVRGPDGMLAGSATPLVAAVRNLVSWGVSLEDAVASAACTSARLAGVAHRKGRVEVGFDADLLLLDADLRLVAAYCRGELAWATDPG